MAERRTEPIVGIIDRQQWPRDLLRAELIERGFVALGYEEIAEAVAAPQGPEIGQPQVIVLEFREQVLDRETLEPLAAAGIPMMILGGDTGVERAGDQGICLGSLDEEALYHRGRSGYGGENHTTLILTRLPCEALRISSSRSPPSHPFTYESFSATFPLRTRKTSIPRIWPCLPFGSTQWKTQRTTHRSPQANISSVSKTA